MRKKRRNKKRDRKRKPNSRTDFLKLNETLEEGNFDFNIISYFTTPGFFMYINERHHSRIFPLLLKFFLPTKEEINKFLESNNFKADALQQFMMCALEIGRCDAVELFIYRKIPLPKSVDKVILTFLMAMTLNNSTIENAILDKFPVDKIFNCAQRHHLFPVSIYFINRGKLDVRKILQDSERDLNIIIELAAARHDLSLLKTLWKDIPVRKRDEIFKKHVSLYFFSESNDILAKQDHTEYQRLCYELINVVRYYMDKGLFTFSLQKESKEVKGRPRLFGPRVLGNLMKWIVCKTQEEKYYLFGSIRRNLDSTKITNKECQALDRVLHLSSRMETLFSKGSVKESSALREMGLFGTEYDVTYQSHDRIGCCYALTKYCKVSSDDQRQEEMDSEERLAFVFLHTNPKQFLALSTEINNFYLRVRSFGQIYSPFKSKEEKISVFKDIARINWLYAQCYLYREGCFDMGSIIFQALFLNYAPVSLERIIFHPWNRFGASMLCENVEDYIKNFPRAFIRESECDDYLSLLNMCCPAEEYTKICEKLDSDFYNWVNQQLRSVEYSTETVPDSIGTTTNSAGIDSVKASVSAAIEVTKTAISSTNTTIASTKKLTATQKKQEQKPFLSRGFLLSSKKSQEKKPRPHEGESQSQGHEKELQSQLESQLIVKEPESGAGNSHLTAEKPQSGAEKPQDTEQEKSSYTNFG